MTLGLPTILVIVALVLALVDLIRAHGEALTGWAVVLVCLALLWGRLG